MWHYRVSKMKKRVRLLLLALSIAVLLTNNNSPPKRHDISPIEKWDNLEFEYCQTLSNAVFDENAYINFFKGSLKQVDPPVSIFTEFIDTAAKDYFDGLMASLTDIDSDSAKRHSCYSTVSSRTLFKDDLLKFNWNFPSISKTPRNFFYSNEKCLKMWMQRHTFHF